MIEDQIARDLARCSIRDSLLLEAGAGTGKTSTMIARTLYAVESGSDVRRHIAITFTVKAAWELIDRLRRSLLDPKQDGDKAIDSRASSVVAYRREAVSRLGEMRVGTIDGLVQSVLEEYAARAGLAGGFRMLDPTRLSARLRVWTTSRMLSWGRERDCSAAWAALERAEVSQTQIEDVFNQVTEEVVRCGEPLRIQGLIDAEALISAWSAHRIGAACQAILDWSALQVTPKDQPKKDDNRRKFEEFADQLVLSSQAILGDSLAQWNPPRPLGNAGGLSAKPIRELLGAAKAELAELFNAIRYREVVPLLQRVADDALQLSQDLDQSGEVGFDRALRVLCNLLRDHPDILLEVQSGIESVMIDEFQDTSREQTELALLLSNNAKTPLFLVGDPKQSIYRFRAADISNYLEFRASAPRLGIGSEALVCNFRSHSKVLDLVNRVFSDRLTMGDEPYPRLIPSAEGIDRIDRPFVAAVGRPCATTAEVTKSDVTTVVGSIRRALAERRQVRDQSTVRDLKFGDIAILVRTRGVFAELLPRLESERIPFRVEGKANPIQSDEVLAVVSILRAVTRDPETDGPEAVRISKFSAARSLGLGLSWETLEQEIDSRLRPFTECVDLPPSKAVLFTLSRLDLGEYAAVHDRPRSVISAQRALVDLALSQESEGVASIREFIDLIDLGTFDEFNPAPATELDDDAVRLMTIHHAKGLEFPMVIVVGFGAAPRAPDSFFVDDRDAYMPIGNLDQGLRPFGHAEKMKTEIGADMQEQWRLLYVALTRARDHLVFCVSHRSSKTRNTEDRIIARICFESGALSDWIEDVPSAWALGSPAPERPCLSFPDTTSVRQAWVERLHRDPRSTPSRLASRSETPSLGSFDHESDYDLDHPLDSLEADNRHPANFRSAAKSGTAFGIAVHLALQQVAFDGSNVSAVSSAAASIYGADRDLVESFVRRALETPSLQSAARSSRVLREVYAAQVIEDGTLMEGILDMVYMEDDGEGSCSAVVVDYKTDRVSSFELAKQRMEGGYQRQGRAYADLVSASLGVRVARVDFIFLHSLEAVVIDALSMD